MKRGRKSRLELYGGLAQKGLTVYQVMSLLQVMESTVRNAAHRYGLAFAPDLPGSRPLLSKYQQERMDAIHAKRKVAYYKKRGTKAPRTNVPTLRQLQAVVEARRKEVETAKDARLRDLGIAEADKIKARQVEEIQSALARGAPVRKSRAKKAPVLTEEQLLDLKTLQRSGMTKAKALEQIQAPKAKISLYKKA